MPGFITSPEIWTIIFFAVSSAGVSTFSTSFTGAFTLLFSGDGFLNVEE